MTLAEFILARITEDEADARTAGAQAWSVTGTWFLEGVEHAVVGDEVAFTQEGYAAHLARHDPARVLAECEAKRRIVELHHAGDAWCDYCLGGDDSDSCATLRLLAFPYAAHPDYDEAWKP